MEVTYDQRADALYIQLTDHLIVTTKRLNDTMAVDYDEFDQVVGFEVLFAREQGIDPLTIVLRHATANTPVEAPDSELINQGRAAREEALKRREARLQAQPETPESEG